MIEFWIGGAVGGVIGILLGQWLTGRRRRREIRGHIRIEERSPLSPRETPDGP